MIMMKYMSRNNEARWEDTVHMTNWEYGCRWTACMASNLSEKSRNACINALEEEKERRNGT